MIKQSKQVIVLSYKSCKTDSVTIKTQVPMWLWRYVHRTKSNLPAQRQRAIRSNLYERSQKDCAENVSWSKLPPPNNNQPWHEDIRAVTRPFVSKPFCNPNYKLNYCSFTTIRRLPKWDFFYPLLWKTFLTLTKIAFDLINTPLPLAFIF